MHFGQRACTWPRGPWTSGASPALCSPSTRRKTAPQPGVGHLITIVSLTIDDANPRGRNARTGLSRPQVYLVGCCGRADRRRARTLRLPAMRRRKARVVATGHRQGERLVVQFPYAQCPFRNTWTHLPDAEAWTLVIEAQETDGHWSTFADYRLTRRQQEFAQRAMRVTVAMARRNGVQRRWRPSVGAPWSTTMFSPCLRPNADLL